MPDYGVTPFDNCHHQSAQPSDAPKVVDDQELTAPLLDVARLPKSGVQAALRGARNRCPSCERVRLFTRFLKSIDSCTACGQDWSMQQADDFPAYVAILLTGHIMAPLIIALVNHASLPMWAMMALIVTLAISMIMALLQPSKGAIIAVQWWLGMHGFVKPRRESSPADSPE